MTAAITLNQNLKEHSCPPPRAPTAPQTRVTDAEPRTGPLGRVPVQSLGARVTHETLAE